MMARGEIMSSAFDAVGTRSFGRLFSDELFDHAQEWTQAYALYFSNCASDNA